jgi:hypothetical protein
MDWRCKKAKIIPTIDANNIVVPPRERAMLDAEIARCKSLLTLLPSPDVVITADVDDVGGRIVVANMIIAQMKARIERMQAILDGVVKAAK